MASVRRAEDGAKVRYYKNANEKVALMFRPVFAGETTLVRAVTAVDAVRDARVQYVARSARRKVKFASERMPGY